MIDCLPVMGASHEETRECFRNALSVPCSMFEWRIDALKGKIRIDEIVDTWNEIRKVTEKPVILTVRTKREGGLRDMDVAEYSWLVRKLIENIRGAFVDIQQEACGSDAMVKMLSAMAAKREIKVIISYHDMHYTQSARDIEMKLMRMKYLGADLPKVAYMANSEADVQALVSGARKAAEKIGELVAISMGEKGQITRMLGDRFGSVINYLKPVGSAYDDSMDIGQLSAGTDIKQSDWYSEE